MYIHIIIYIPDLCVCAWEGVRGGRIVTDEHHEETVKVF